jgi:hypothetical protein
MTVADLIALLKSCTQDAKITSGKIVMETEARRTTLVLVKPAALDNQGQSQ